MLLPPRIGLTKRALGMALAIALEAGLASVGMPCAASVEEAVDTPAADMQFFPAAGALDGIDDSVLARQRGGQAGAITVAAVVAIPDSKSHGGSVTLWDEFPRPASAPPISVPMTVDRAGTAQCNAVSYTRK